ncbi:unnamed protein product [Ectocarpus sp. 12 AP-2014]
MWESRIKEREHVGVNPLTTTAFLPRQSSNPWIHKRVPSPKATCQLLPRIRPNTMRGEHVGTVGTTLLLVGGFVAKAGAAGSFDPMVHMMRSLFTTTYTDGDACPAEDAACLASASCLACNDAYIAAFSGCAASLTSTSTCDDLVDAMCCAVEGCEDNEEFADIMARLFPGPTPRRTPRPQPRQTAPPKSRRVTRIRSA